MSISERDLEVIVLNFLCLILYFSFSSCSSKICYIFLWSFFYFSF